jgi:hypothetical protein
MATTVIDSFIIAKATQEAWDQAIGLFNGDPIRAAEYVQKGMTNLANKVSLQRTLAAQLDIESSPEAMRRRLETEKKVREAGASAIKAHGAKLADLAAKTGADLKAKAEAVQADIRRNGAHTAGM